MKENFYRVDREFWNTEEGVWVGDLGWSFADYMEVFPATDYKNFEEFAALVEEGLRYELQNGTWDDAEKLIPCYLIYTQEEEEIYAEPEYKMRFLGCSEEKAKQSGLNPKADTHTHYVSLKNE